jgi:hypothetical protein
VPKPPTVCDGAPIRDVQLGLVGVNEPPTPIVDKFAPRDEARLGDGGASSQGEHKARERARRRRDDRRQRP